MAIESDYYVVEQSEPTEGFPPPTPMTTGCRTKGAPSTRQPTHLPRLHSRALQMAYFWLDHADMTHRTEAGRRQDGGRTEAGSQAGSRFHVRNVLGMTLISDFPRAASRPNSTRTHAKFLSAIYITQGRDGGWNRQREGWKEGHCRSHCHYCHQCHQHCLPFISPERCSAEERMAERDV